MRDIRRNIEGGCLSWPEQRAMLADHLLASLDGPDQKRIDALWAEEAERRLREIKEGKVEAIDGELVMQRLRADSEDELVVST